MAAALDPGDPGLLVVNWPALERMWPCADYGKGFWLYVGESFAERNSWGPLPHDPCARGLMSRRGFLIEDDAIAGEFTAKGP